MRWRELNPDFALQSRLSFGRGARYAWGAIAGALFLGFGVSLPRGPASALALAGAFLLLAALPYGAIHVRALEREGHLDARRLTGRTPGSLALALVSGSAWALAAAAAGLIAAGAAAGFVFPVLTIAGLVLMGGAIALIILLLPPSTHLDNWLLLVFLVLGVVGTVPVMAADRGAALGTVVVSLLVYPWAVPLALRRMRGSTVSPGCAPRSLAGSTSRIARTAMPEFARLLAMQRTSLMTAAPLALAAPVLLLWILAAAEEKMREPLLLMVVGVPLLIAAYEVGSRARADVTSGAMERIRLTDQRPWSVVLQIAVAGAIPFLIPSVVAAVSLAVLDPPRAGGVLRWWPLAAALWVFGEMAEGLRGRRSGTYLVILVPLSAVTATHGTVSGLLAVAVVALVAVGSLDGNSKPALRGWSAVVASALFGALATALASGGPGALVVAGLMSLAAGLLVGDRSAQRSRFVIPVAIAAAIGCWIAAYVWMHPGFVLHARIHFSPRGNVFVFPARGIRHLNPIVVAAAGCAGLMYGLMAHNQYGRTRARSFAVRAVPLALTIGLLPVRHSLRVYDSMVSFALNTGYYAPGVGELFGIMLLAAVAVVLARREWRLIRAPRQPS